MPAVGEVVISRAGAESIDAFEPLWKAMQAHHRSVAPHLEEIAPIRSDDDSWARRRKHYERVLGDPDTFAFLAERDGRPVGYAVVKIMGTESTLEVGEQVAELDSLAVVAEERGHGLGGALMDAVYDELRRRGIREMALAVMEGNEGAARFYERRGFIPYLRYLLGRVPEA
jgi:ribosomal protein S18 acetylase RimI-like enzyme